MDIASAHAIRDRSESWKRGQSGPWKRDEGEMIKKTCVKQAYEYWPKSKSARAKTEALPGMYDRLKERADKIGGPE